MRQREYRERCKTCNDENREFMVVNREKRDKTFGKTIQEQLNNFHFHGEKKQTEEKLRALGPYGDSDRLFEVSFSRSYSFSEHVYIG